MSGNPFKAFAIAPQMPYEDIEAELKQYKTKILAVCAIYAEYYKQIRDFGNIGVHVKMGEETENLLSKRYEFGLSLDRDCLAKEELDDLVKSIRSTEDSNEKNAENEAKRRSEKGKKLEMFHLSSMEAIRIKGKIEKAFQTYKDSGFEDTSKMMDMLLELKAKDKVIEIADTLAKEMSEQGYVCTAEQFKETLTQYKPYIQLKAIYEQINTQDKRNDYIPEYYVLKNMTDTTQFGVTTTERINRLIEKEKAYMSKYFAEIETRISDPDIAKQKEFAENQGHDYAWGIILDPSRYMFKNEPVSTPIFKGKLTVERIGSFTEYSMFAKRKRERENQVKVRNKAYKPKKTFLPRLRIVQNTSKTPEGVEDGKYHFMTMREVFFRYEATKALADHLFRVTKTDTSGRTRTSIIVSPVEYNGSEGLEYKDFLKNVYFSDYMLDVAERNGGYAGMVIPKDNGYYISNIHNYEEIASSILFSCGQKGTIFDCRNRKDRVKYGDSNKKDLIRLLDKPERERVKDE